MSTYASVIFSISEKSRGKGQGFTLWPLVGTTALKLCMQKSLIHAIPILYTEPAPIVHQADVVTSDNPACSKVGQGVLQEVSVQ